jgi:hypothetical protein
MGVAEATPGLWGWSGHPERPKKKKKEKNGFGILGVAGPPPRAWGWLRPPPTTGRWCPKPPPTTSRWCPKPPPGPRGWSGHPQNPKPFFFFFLAFRGGRTTPKGLGWLRPPPYGRYGVADHPLAKNGVVRPPHFLGKGWLQPPRFLPLFCFFIFLFLISFFFH